MYVTAEFVITEFQCIKMFDKTLLSKIINAIEQCRGVCFDKFHKENKKPKALHAFKLMEYCLLTSQGLSDSKQNQSTQKLSRINHFTFI